MTRRAQRSARSQGRKTSSSSYSPPPAEILSCLHPQPPHEVEEEEKAKPTRTRARPRSKTISALPSSSSSSFPSPLLSSSAPTEHREGRRKDYLSPSPSRRRHRRSSSRSRSRSPSRSPSLGRRHDGERRHKREHGHRRRRHRNRHQERERRQGSGREEKLDAFSSLRHLERELEAMIAAEKERCRLKEINAELESTESAETDQSRWREDKKAHELTLKQQEEEANCSLHNHLKEEWRNPFEGVAPLAASLWQPQRDSSVLVAPSFSLPPLLSLPPLTPPPALPFYEGISFNSDFTLRPLQEERAEAAERERKTQFGQAIDEWNSSYVSVLEEQQAEQQISTEPSDKEEEEQVQEQEPTTTNTTKRKHDRVIDDVTASRSDTEIISSSSSASLQLLPKMKKARLVPQDEEHVSLEKKRETSNEKESSQLSIGTLSGIVRRDEEAASTPECPPSPSPSSSSSVKLFSLSKKKHSITGQRILSTLNNIEDHSVDWSTLDAVLFMNLDRCPYESIDERMASLFATGKLFLVGCCGGNVPAAPFPLSPFEAISDANRFVISRNGTSKNAAECAMCFFLATLNVTVPTDIPFFILSPNADSDAVTHQLLRSGRTAVRLLPLSNDESGTSDNVLLTPSRLDELLAATRKKNTTTTIIPSPASPEESLQEEEQQQQSNDGQPKKKQSGCLVM